MGTPSITIRIAGRGTPRDGLEPSAMGHMWVELNDGNGTITSLGFAPIEVGIYEQGHVSTNDNETYLAYQYSKTIPINVGQYDDMMDYYPTWNDDMYIGMQHDCINFVWDLLEQGGLNPEGIDGHPWPPSNAYILDKMFPNNPSEGDTSLPIGDIPLWCLPAQGMFSKGPTIASPLVLDLDGDGIEVTKMGYGANSSNVYFDIDNDGFAERTAWVTGGDGLLAWDKNANGVIDNQSELFGNSSTYADGFAYLATLNTNGDNKITSADTNWSNLRVWVDVNEDGITDAGELKTLASLGITEISLNSTAITNTYNNENLVSDTSTFVIGGQTRAVHDIWFRNDATDTRYTGDVTLDEAVFFLPTLRGYGELKDLHVAMSEDSDLLDLVSDFVTNWETEKFEDKAALDAEIKEILFAWAGVENVNPASRGASVDAQEVAFLEQYFGKSHDVNIIPLAQGNHLSALFDYVLQNLGSHLIAQSGIANIYEDTPLYNYITGDMVGGVLSSSAISALASEAALAPNSQQYWVNLASVLISIKNPAQFTTSETSALNSAIQTTLPLLSWSSIVSQATIVLTNTYLETPFSDIIAGGAGNDTLYGGAGDDIYYFEAGSGQDTIIETSGSDKILFGAGIDSGDVLMWLDYQGHLTIKYSATGDLVKVMAGVVSGTTASTVGSHLEQVVFADSTTWNLTGGLHLKTDTHGQSYGTNYDDVLEGGSGGNTLYGNGGNDTLIGGAGRDILYGGTGNDTYVFNLGEGFTGNPNLVYEYAGEGNDTILFGAGIDAEDVLMWLDYQGHLTIKYSATDDMIKVMAGVVSGTTASTVGSYLEQIVFADSTTWNLTGGLHLKTDTSGQSYGTNYDDVLEGGSGGNTLYGNGGNDTLIGGAGRDILFGGTGNDTYVFNLGEGFTNNANQVWEYLGEGTDKILFGAGIDSDDVLMWLDYQGHLTIKYSVTDDMVKVMAGVVSGTTASTVGSYLEQIIFVDSTTWNLTGGLHLKTDTSGQSYGTNYDDVLEGGSGSNTLYGNGGNDILIGGAGRDILYGGTGNDTYVFNLGEGFTGNPNLIYESVGEGTDKILFGAGIDSDDVLMWLDYQGHLTIKYSATDDHIKIMAGVVSGTTASTVGSHLEQVVFADSTTWNLTGGLHLKTDTHGQSYGTNYDDVLEGGSGNNVLYGNGGNDTLIGGSGNDTLYGGAGSDIFLFDISTLGSIDTIADFSLAQNDKIDISELLDGYDPLTHAITDWVEITTSGSNSILKVDTNGGGNSFVQIATISGVTGLTDEAALVTSGNLIVT